MLLYRVKRFAFGLSHTAIDHIGLGQKLRIRVAFLLINILHLFTRQLGNRAPNLQLKMVPSEAKESNMQAIVFFS